MPESTTSLAAAWRWVVAAIHAAIAFGVDDALVTIVAAARHVDRSGNGSQVWRTGIAPNSHDERRLAQTRTSARIEGPTRHLECWTAVRPGTIVVETTHELVTYQKRSRTIRIGIVCAPPDGSNGVIVWLAFGEHGDLWAVPIAGRETLLVAREGR